MCGTTGPLLCRSVWSFHNRINAYNVIARRENAFQSPSSLQPVYNSIKYGLQQFAYSYFHYSVFSFSSLKLLNYVLGGVAVLPRRLRPPERKEGDPVHLRVAKHGIQISVKQGVIAHCSSPFRCRRFVRRVPLRRVAGRSPSRRAVRRPAK